MSSRTTLNRNLNPKISPGIIRSSHAYNPRKLALLPTSSSSLSSCPFTATPRRTISSTSPLRATTALAAFKVPPARNEPNNHYAPGSPDREALQAAIAAFKKTTPIEVPVVVGGKAIRTATLQTQRNPADHSSVVARYPNASSADVGAAIESALAAKREWENVPFVDRAAVFLKAAELVSRRYRYELMAATMVGQGKNAWQAEIDAAAEVCDFFRFNVEYAEQLYAQQPVHNTPGVWNRVEYRPLEGFVYAVSPFNFTAIGANLAGAPALMGNVVLWKPSPFAMAANYLTLSILTEAGLPPGVIQFVPGDAEEVTGAALQHESFSGLHFTGSTAVFRALYGRIAAGVAEGRYRAGYPRIVGETGGKNFHLVHASAEVSSAVYNTIRAAFEFQGQKCSACSRAYVARSVWPEFKALLVRETEKLRIGDPEDFSNFMGPVIHEAAFRKLTKVIDDSATDPALELVVHIYDDAAPDALAAICDVINATSGYGLTGAVFARDREAVRFVEDRLRHSAGNFYINAKCTGAIVGQQPFGGARASGTNDKAGSMSLLARFVSMRAIKEEFLGPTAVTYPSNR